MTQVAFHQREKKQGTNDYETLKSLQTFITVCQVLAWLLNELFVLVYIHIYIFRLYVFIKGVWVWSGPQQQKHLQRRSLNLDASNTQAFSLAAKGYKKSVPKFSITSGSLKTNVMHKYAQIIIICASVLISIAIFASHNYTKVIFKMHAPPMQCKATTTMLK